MAVAEAVYPALNPRTLIVLDAERVRVPLRTGDESDGVLPSSVYRRVAPDVNEDAVTPMVVVNDDDAGEIAGVDTVSV